MCVLLAVSNFVAVERCRPVIVRQHFLSGDKVIFSVLRTQKTVDCSSFVPFLERRAQENVSSITREALQTEDTPDKISPLYENKAINTSVLKLFFTNCFN